VDEGGKGSWVGEGRGRRRAVDVEER